MPSVRFIVYGTPIPQGSMRAFVRGGRAILTHNSTKVLPWRQDVAAQAVAAGLRPVRGPIDVKVIFWLTRPTSRAKKYRDPDRRPDLDKMVRSLFDALTGIAWYDDAQVVALDACKRYADDRPGALVTVTTSDRPK